MTSVKKIKVALLALVAALVIAIPTSAFAGTITINGEKVGDGHTYEVYQIFTGDLDDDGNLGDIQWGSSIDQTKLPTGYTNAADVAKMLDVNSTEGTKIEARAFAELIKGALGTPVVAKMAVSGTTYTADVADNGYYLVKDKDDTVAEASAYTQYILTKGTSTEPIEIKASAPTVEKEVKEDRDNSWGETGDFNIDQVIDYRLTGTLPSTYDSYDWYEYQFNDQMSAGLDLVKGSVKITKNTDDGASLDEYFTVSYDEDAHLLTITAKAGDNEKYLKNAPLAFGDKVIVNYQAKLNQNCIVGSTGNPNEVDLDFSNNPNQDGKGDKGRTEKDYCVVFTYELDNTKTGEGEYANGLPNAKFVLKGAEGYAIVDPTTNKLTGWAAEQSGGTELVSGADGKFIVIGLDEGEYQLIETVAPDGYALLAEPVSFKITATTSQNTGVGKIETLQIQIGKHEAQDGDKDKGIVKTDISNTLSLNLPSTGGIGTTIFTVVGILLMAVAAFMVIRRRSAAAQQ